MKKILEVLQYGPGDIRFNTDIKAKEHPQEIMSITCGVAFAMVTKLWGGNETDVIAAIRALAIADIAVSVDMDDMLDKLGMSAAEVRNVLDEAKKEFVKNGGKVTTFGPGIMPGKAKS